MALLKEQERLCRELGDKAGLSASLGNQANILYGRGQPDAAMALMRQAEQLFRELGDPNGLAISLTNQAGMLTPRDPRRALLLMEEAYELAVTHGLLQLASQIKPFLDDVRARVGGH
jgi:hypothetical protein